MAGNGPNAVETQEFLKLALSAGNYISALNECVTSGNRWWTVNYSGELEYSPEIFSGVSGIVLFLSDLFAVTRDGGFKALAEGGAGWVDEKARSESGGGVGRYRGLYSGFSGHGLAMLRLAQVTGDARWLAQARARADALIGTAYGITELMYGAAGAGVFLLRLNQQTGDPQFLEEATRAGDHILQKAESDGEGLKWLIELGGNARYQIGMAHGAAGIGYFLAELYRLTGNASYRNGALGAARWLAACSIGTEHGPGWPRYPGDPDAPRVQWCHGSAGIGLFFTRTFEATGDPLCKEFALSCGESTYAAGDLRKNPSQCHGLAGNGELFLELERIFGGGAWRARAEEFGRLAATYREGTAPDVKWRSDEAGQFSPDFMTGAAGTGHFLLRLANPDSIQMPLMVLPG